MQSKTHDFFQFGVLPLKIFSRHSSQLYNCHTCKIKQTITMALIKQEINFDSGIQSH